MPGDKIAIIVKVYPMVVEYILHVMHVCPKKLIGQC